MRLTKPGNILLLSLLSVSGSLLATDRYIDPAGSDVSNDCSVLASPCATLQNANDQSSSGDTIHAAAGTYTVSGLVTINKTLTILGAQAGVDARTRSGAESVLSNTQGISVAASGVVFDGFTIQDSSVAAFTGYGVWINPGMDGTQIVNNIIQNNIVGLGLSNLGTTQAVIQHNVFQNNNLAGGASGTGIYTDQFVGGQVSNVLIDSNNFLNNENAGIGLSSTDTTNLDNNLTISNNVIDSCGRGMYVFATTSSTFENNTVSNLTVPTDGGTSTGLAIDGGVSNFTVTGNAFQTGPGYGIRVRSVIPPATNDNILIHTNNILNFAIDGMLVDDAPATGPVDYATCNWWGSATGPFNATLNPAGTGDSIAGSVILANFFPWSVSPFGACPTVTPPTVSKRFNPDEMFAGHKSYLMITLKNTSSSPAILTAPLVDTLPAGVTVFGSDSNTCGGTTSAPVGGSTLTLTGGIIPAMGSCKVSVRVTSSVVGDHVNTIAAGALQTTLGSNTASAEAVLSIITNPGE